MIAMLEAGARRSDGRRGCYLVDLQGGDCGQHDPNRLDALSTSVNYVWLDGTYTSEIASYSAFRSLTIRSDNVDLVARLSLDLGNLLENKRDRVSQQPAVLRHQLTIRVRQIRRKPAAMALGFDLMTDANIVTEAADHE